LISCDSPFGSATTVDIISAAHVLALITLVDPEQTMIESSGAEPTEPGIASRAAGA
jgi:hypothetical protein